MKLMQLMVHTVCCAHKHTRHRRNNRRDRGRLVKLEMIFDIHRTHDTVASDLWPMNSLNLNQVRLEGLRREAGARLLYAHLQRRLTAAWSDLQERVIDGGAPV